MMWVVFWTFRADDPKLFRDAYVLVDSEAAALDLVTELKSRDTLTAVGHGSVSSTLFR
jgi:hypothetical protein